MKFTERKTSSGKVHEGTLGNVTVKIYERTRKISKRGKRTRTLFDVVDYTEGRRAFRGFSTFADAAQEAGRLAKLISTGQTAAATLRNCDAASFGRALELLRGIDTPLEMVAAHYAKAFKVLGGDRIVEAAKDFARRNPILREPRSVRQVAGELIELQTKRAKSDRYVDDLRWRLGIFTKAFAHDVANVTTADVPRVALESGNSPAMIFAHYRELLTADDAKKWFAIAPQHAANVVPIAAARK